MYTDMELVKVEPYKIVGIHATINDVIKYHEGALNIITYLSILIPIILKHRFKMKYSKEKFHLITKDEYIACRNAFYEELKNLKCKKIKTLVPVLKYNKSLTKDTKAIDTLQEFFKTNKEQFKKIPNEAKIEVNRVLNLFKIKEVKDSTLKNISTLGRYLPDTKIKNLLKSIEGFSDDTISEKFEEAKRRFERFLQKKFGQDTLLTPEQARQVRDEDPDLYKMYNKLHGERKKLAKQVLENVWNENDYELLDVKEAKKLLKELDIPNPIDKGFVGKVGLSTSPTGLFDYYTIYGKQLGTVPGKNVVMNPNYTKDDNCNYCTCEPQGVSTRKSRASKLVYIYTIDYRSNATKKKHNAVDNIENMGELRAKYMNDIQPIIQGSYNEKNICALITAVIDITCGRIGSSKESLENGVYGISILKVKHISFGKKKIGDEVRNVATLKYVGKDSMNQKHDIPNQQVIKALKVMIINKKPNDFIFSKDGKTNIVENTVNKYIKSIGFPSGFTAHTFRKYHANRMFKKYTQGVKNDDPIKTFNNVVNKIANKLGHLPINSIKSYIDPKLMEKYFSNHDVEIPKKVRKVLEDYKNGTNKEDD